MSSSSTPRVSRTNFSTNSSEIAANAAYTPYESGRLNCAITGKLLVIAKFASHWAAAATASAIARMRLGNISPSNTHTTGPQLTPKKITQRLAATSATGPQAPGRFNAVPLPVAWAKHTAITANVTSIPDEPITSSALRPIRSISPIATSVTSTFTIEVMTVSMNELDSLNPTEFHKVVE